MTSWVVVPSAYYLLQERDDEGTHYWFQLEGQVLALGGPDFPPSKTFPSACFEIAEGHSADGKLVFSKIYCEGPRLEPDRIISGAEKWRLFESPHYPDPDRILLLPGTLEELLQRTRSR